MENIKNVFEAETLAWIKDITQRKFASWTNSVQDFSAFEDGGEPFPPMFDPREHFQKAINVAGKIKNKISECNNFEEIDTYIASLDAKERGRINEMMTSSKVREELDDSLTSISIESDIVRDTFRLKETYDSIQNTLKKIGLDTPLSDVDKEDVEYVLNNLIESINNAVKSWAVKYPKISNGMKDELAIISSSTKTLKEKWEAAEAIDHFIESANEIDIPEILGEAMSQDDDALENRMEFLKKVQEFYEGTAAVVRLLNVTELSSMIFEKIN